MNENILEKIASEAYEMGLEDGLEKSASQQRNRQLADLNNSMAIEKARYLRDLARAKRGERQTGGEVAAQALGRTILGTILGGGLGWAGKGLGIKFMKPGYLAAAGGGMGLVGRLLAGRKPISAENARHRYQMMKDVADWYKKDQIRKNQARFASRY